MSAKRTEIILSLGISCTLPSYRRATGYSMLVVHEASLNRRSAGDTEASVLIYVMTTCWTKQPQLYAAHIAKGGAFFVLRTTR
jgi:hypothetical protein